MNASPVEALPGLVSIIVALADEGVPVRAIARATKIPGEDVYPILHTAVDEGRIIEIPKDDWPPGTRRAQRSQTESSVLTFDDAALRLACAATFKLTQTQAAVFLALLRRPEITKDALHNAIESLRAPSSDPTDMKMVDVIICHVRKKLKPYFGPDIIRTLWGAGYSILPVDRARALEALSSTMFPPRTQGTGFPASERARRIRGGRVMAIKTEEDTRPAWLAPGTQINELMMFEQLNAPLCANAAAVLISGGMLMAVNAYDRKVNRSAFYKDVLAPYTLMVDNLGRVSFIQAALAAARSHDGVVTEKMLLDALEHTMHELHDAHGAVTAMAKQLAEMAPEGTPIS